MEVKLKLSNDEHKDLIAYCNLNDLLVSSVVKDSFTTGFNIERYGLLNANKDKVIEKEVIREKRVEIPVEVIKEVVKIEYIEVEKPVEKIVEKVVEVPVTVTKEVPVERVVEKVVEVIKEIPVEKVVVQEVIKEVPVEKVIVQEVMNEIVKEVPVEKIVYVTDQEEMNAKIFQKEQEFDEQRKNFSTKTQEMEKIFQNEKNELLSKIQQLENTPPKIVEVIKEIPIDKVVVQEKIVEVVKEVPVEVIKEVIIEKDGGGDKNKLEALQQTLMKIRQENIEKDKLIKEYEKTIQDIQSFQEEKKAVYLSGSNLDKKLYK